MTERQKLDALLMASGKARAETKPKAANGARERP
jgi:hypothetical protein